MLKAGRTLNSGKMESDISMKNWESKLLGLLGAIFLLLLVALGILVIRNTMQRVGKNMSLSTGYEAEFFALRLKASDLPDGYRGEKIPELIKENGGKGEEYIYFTSGFASSFNIVHRVVIFDTPTLANHAFDETLSSRRQTKFHINESLEAVDDTLYATNLAWGCDEPLTTVSAQISVSTQYCSTIATYHNVYVEIRGHTFTDRLLTMEKYIDLVQHLDQRAGQVLKISNSR